jgi:hypothetical protein
MQSGDDYMTIPLKLRILFLMWEMAGFEIDVRSTVYNLWQFKRRSHKEWNKKYCVVIF